VPSTTVGSYVPINGWTNVARSGNYVRKYMKKCLNYMRRLRKNGKYQVELHAITAAEYKDFMDANVPNMLPGSDAYSWAFEAFGQNLVGFWHDGMLDDTKWKEGCEYFSNGDVIGIAVNIELGKIAISKIGDWSEEPLVMGLQRDRVSKGVYPCFAANSGTVH